jgi:hypothetical protein
VSPEKSKMSIANAFLPYQTAKNFNMVGAKDINDFSIKYDYKMHFSATRVNTREQILLARLALRAYKLEHQQSAPNLETLVVQKYLKKVPMDGFSMTGDAPLQYNPKTDTVWSVGNNGKNDNNTGDDLLKTF